MEILCNHTTTKLNNKWKSTQDRTCQLDIIIFVLLTWHLLISRLFWISQHCDTYISNLVCTTVVILSSVWLKEGFWLVLTLKHEQLSSLTSLHLLVSSLVTVCVCVCVWIVIMLNVEIKTLQPVEFMVMIPDNPQRGVQLSDSNTQEADCHHRRVAVDYHVHPRGRRDVHERTFVCHSWNEC